jgi:serine/threonine protein kinase
VKPGNILLYRDGSPRLTDFGIVKDIGTLKGFLLEGRRVGTAAYASPEQCLGKRLGPATDVYSLGATLYHMVCGRPPFPGDTPNEILNKHVKAKLPSPMRLCPEIPKTLSNAIAKMLSKRQADRYPSMARLVEDLELILDGKIAISNGRASVNLRALGGVRSSRSSWREALRRKAL